MASSSAKDGGRAGALDDNRIHLLRRVDSGKFREVTSETDWPSVQRRRRRKSLHVAAADRQVDVKRVAPKWIFRIPDAGRLQGTPVVADGVMYVTNANECYALDAGNGRQIWRYQRPRSTGLAGDAATGINRGVALGGDKLFMVTDNAHLIALDRATGLLVWDIEMADWRQNHGATSAPLAVDTSSFPEPAAATTALRDSWLRTIRPLETSLAFLDDPETGRAGVGYVERHRVEHGGANTWFTGTYDKETDTLFWPTAIPVPTTTG